MTRTSNACFVLAIIVLEDRIISRINDFVLSESLSNDFDTDAESIRNRRSITESCPVPSEFER